MHCSSFLVITLNGEVRNFWRKLYKALKALPIAPYYVEPSKLYPIGCFETGAFWDFLIPRNNRWYGGSCPFIFAWIIASMFLRQRY